MSFLKNTSKQDNKKTVLWSVIGLFSFIILTLLLYLGHKVPVATSVDFSSIRKNLSNQNYNNYGTNNNNSNSQIQSVTSDNAFHAQRASYVNQSRARFYVDDALMDYYKGDFSEAIRRVERAKSYDPTNFSALRLSAQIYLDQRKYRKAYEDLERAKQIPNEDETLARDLDIVRKLIRYTRSDTDRLKRYTYHNPEDKIAVARLNELIEQMEY